MKVKSLSRVQLFTTPCTTAYQAPPSMGFSRQEYWSGVPLPSPAIRYKYLFPNNILKLNFNAAGISLMNGIGFCFFLLGCPVLFVGITQSSNLKTSLSYLIPFLLT